MCNGNNEFVIIRVVLCVKDSLSFYDGEKTRDPLLGKSIPLRESVKMEMDIAIIRGGGGGEVSLLFK